MRGIAEFLEIDRAESRWPTLLEHCGSIHEGPRRQVARGGAISTAAARPSSQGRQRRWRDVLSAEESATTKPWRWKQMGPDCARWLANGKRA